MATTPMTATSTPSTILIGADHTYRFGGFLAGGAVVWSLVFHYLASFAFSPLNTRAASKVACHVFSGSASGVKSVSPL